VAPGHLARAQLKDRETADIEIRPEHARVLEELTSRLSGSDVTWALTGSLGHRLQGVPVEVHDVDIQTDEHGAYRIERIFRDEVVRAVHERSSSAIRSHFGQLLIGGVEVEVMGGVQKRLPDGSWERPVDVAEHRVLVSWGPLEIPVLSLQYEAQAYQILGRHDRAALLRRHCGDASSEDSEVGNQPA
jgi:hypothetical protein